MVTNGNGSPLRGGALPPPPVEERRHCDPQGDRNERRTDLDQQPGCQDRCADEVLPAHFQDITTKTTSSITERTIVGGTSDLFQVRSRTPSRRSRRTSCSCLRARLRCH